MQVPVRLSFGNVELGNWTSLDRDEPVPLRNFSGRIDEVVLFREALTAEEIAELYSAGEPLR